MNDRPITRLEENTFLDLASGIGYEFSLDTSHVDVYAPGSGVLDVEQGEPNQCPYNSYSGEASMKLYDRISFIADQFDRAFEARKARVLANQAIADGES